jgi:hypothetical protein
MKLQRKTCYKIATKIFVIRAEGGCQDVRFEKKVTV